MTTTIAHTAAHAASFDYGAFLKVAIPVAITVIVVAVPIARVLLRGRAAKALGEQLGLNEQHGQMTGQYRGYDIELNVSSSQVVLKRRGKMCQHEYELVHKGSSGSEQPVFITGDATIDAFFTARHAAPPVAEAAAERPAQAARIAAFIEKWGPRLHSLFASRTRLLCTLRAGVGKSRAGHYLPAAEMRELLPELTQFADTLEQWLNPQKAGTAGAPDVTFTQRNP
jgi:hypothetical protein